MIHTMSEADLKRLARACYDAPDKVVILPEDAYTTVGNQQIVRIEVDGIRVYLHRWLYDQTHDEPLGTDILHRRKGISPRNVNPFLFERRSRKARTLADVCSNGHRYSEVGEVDKSGYRCAACFESHLERRRVGGDGHDVGSINRAKTHCPRNHEYTPENTLSRPSDKGRRRCRTCERDREVKRHQDMIQKQREDGR